MKKLLVIIILSIGLIYSGCAEPLSTTTTDPNSTTTTSTTTTTTSTTIQGTLDVFFLDGYGMTTPKMYLWQVGKTGYYATNAGTTNIGGYDFIHFTTTVKYTGNTYYYFKDNTVMEPLNIQGTANRFVSFTVSATNKTAFAISYNRQSWTQTTLLAAIAEPDNWGAVTNFLGANIQPDGTTVYFSIFAPGSTRARVAGEFTTWATSAVDMSLTPDGQYWWAKMTITSPEGQMYKFILDSSTWTADPYAKAWLYDSGNKNSMLYSTNNYTWTDGSWTRPSYDELVIYELHIKDFTSDATSGVNATNSGKLGGIIEKIVYLTNLGVNAVEFMPTSEFDNDDYSWGYNTQYFFATENGYGYYSGGVPDGSQNDQFRYLIDSCHDAELAVILDMVYNHIGSGDNSFWAVDNVYYFDWDNDGNTEAGTGEDDATPWGNRFCTWRPMVKKLIYDNLKYFIEVYHVDGFRFDATSYVDHTALKAVIAQLQAEYPDVYFMAEQLPNATDMYDSGIAQWSGVFHDKMKAMLKLGSFEGENANDIGNVAKMVYYSRDDNFASSPLETLNYFESHDENSVYNELVVWSSTTAEFATNATRLGAVCLFTSMGTPMIMAGQEWLKNREGQNINEVNGRINWNWQTTSATNIHNFYRGLINLRRNHPALRMTDADPATAGTFRWSIVSGTWGMSYPYTIYSAGMILGYELNVDGSISDNKFVVVLNFGTTAQTLSVKFPTTGTWTLICDGEEVDEGGLGAFAVTDNGDGGETNYTIPARTGLIFMQ